MKKRILSLALVLCLVVGTITVLAVTANAEPTSIWDGSVALSFDGGDGSAENPYQISDGSQLAYMAELINEDETAGYSAMHYELTADITLNLGDAADWAETAPDNAFDPIGYYKFGADEAGVRANQFCGTFEGNGYTISGMYVNADRSAAPFMYVGAGMFAMANGATIRNFALVNSYICARDQVGAIVGLLSTEVDGGVIENIYSDAIIDYGTYTTGGSNGAGGIVGHGTKDGGIVTIQNCVFAGSVNAAKAGGGIAGNSNSKGFNITNCINVGAIVSGEYAGGIVGRNAGEGKLTISKCINIGSVTGNYIATISYNTSGYAIVSDVYVVNTDLTCRKARMNGSDARTDYYTVSAANSVADFIGTEVSTDITDVLTEWTERENDIMVPTAVINLVPTLYMNIIPEVTTASDDATTAPDDATTAPDDATTAPDDATTAPDDATTAPDDATTAPDDATTAPDDGTTAPDDGTTAPDDGTTAPDNTTTKEPEGSGCGGSALGTLLPALAILIGTGAFIITKKKI